MTKIKLIGALIITALIIIVIIQNTELVETDILFFSVTMPRAILLALAGLLGFGVGILTSILLARKNAKKN